MKTIFILIFFLLIFKFCNSQNQDLPTNAYELDIFRASDGDGVGPGIKITQLFLSDKAEDSKNRRIKLGFTFEFGYLSNSQTEYYFHSVNAYAAYLFAVRRFQPYFAANIGMLGESQFESEDWGLGLNLGLNIFITNQISLNFYCKSDIGIFEGYQVSSLGFGIRFYVHRKKSCFFI